MTAHPQQPADLTGSALARLADEIADRLAERLGPAIAELIVGPGPVAATRGASVAPTARGDAGRTTELWTAREVAAHYGVGAPFVYEHADELGCIRIGGGPRPRLRFDPQIVHDRWSAVGATPPTAAPRRRRRQSAERRERRAKDRGYELIDFEREP